MSESLPLKPAELVESLSLEWRQRYARIRSVEGEMHYALDWPEN